MLRAAAPSSNSMMKFLVKSSSPLKAAFMVSPAATHSDFLRKNALIAVANFVAASPHLISVMTFRSDSTSASARRAMVSPSSRHSMWLIKLFSPRAMRRAMPGQSMPPITSSSRLMNELNPSASFGPNCSQSNRASAFPTMTNFAVSIFASVRPTAEKSVFSTRPFRPSARAFPSPARSITSNAWFIVYAMVFIPFANVRPMPCQSMLSIRPLNMPASAST